MTLLSTSRLKLRAPQIEDVDAITAACQDPAVQRWVPVPVPYEREHALAYVNKYTPEGWQSGQRCTWAIEHQDSFAGTIGLDSIEDGAGELGYWLAPKFRRNALMREAAKAVIDFAFQPSPQGLGLSRVGWRAYAGNTASAALAAHLGFHYEGTVRLGAMGRTGREDDWLAGLLASDERLPQDWPIT